MPSPYDFYNYQNYWKGRSYEDNSERMALEKFFAKISLREVIVDIGGGFGRLCNSYSALFKKCILIDPSQKNIAEGKNLYKNFDNILFKKGSLPSLELPDNLADAVLMIRVAHHLDNLKPSFGEINRILKKDGFFIFEFANKLHFIAKIKALLSLNFKYFSDTSPVEKRSQSSIKQRKITFVNHHPQKIIEDLKSAGFEIVDKLSVSNFRSSILKKILPRKPLLYLEKIAQKPLSEIFFGPSVFLLAKKII